MFCFYRCYLYVIFIILFEWFSNYFHVILSTWMIVFLFDDSLILPVYLTHPISATVGEEDSHGQCPEKQNKYACSIYYGCSWPMTMANWNCLEAFFYKSLCLRWCSFPKIGDYIGLLFPSFQDLCRKSHSIHWNITFCQHSSVYL